MQEKREIPNKWSVFLWWIDLLTDWSKELIWRGMEELLIYKSM